MVGSWKVHHFKGENLRAEVRSAAERDGQVDLPERVCLRSRDHPVEGRAHQAEFRPGDAHGVEGVDVEDAEPAVTFYQHLGEALLMDNGVDDERLATQSGDVGRMVPRIKSDRRFRPAKEGGDGGFDGACLSVVHLVLALGVDGIESPEDHDSFLGIRKAIPILARLASFLGRCLLVLSFFLAR